MMVGSPAQASNLRLDIQGLRALAVALVVVFHLSPKLLSGGYIGVDVFFVISGYLITSHLLREVERTGGVKLSQFWARRVRRLIPAALLVLLVSAGAVLLLFPRTGAAQNLSEIGFAAVYVLNWALAANSVDYLAADNAPSIAQHYWSLSVEEQFYIVWPILIIVAVWVAAKVKRVSRQQAIATLLFVVFLASLAFSIYETARSQPSAYFFTTTRAWEFALGGLMAMLPVITLRGRYGAPVKVVASWAALAAIVGSAFLFDAQTAFPGWIALIPVLATGFLLWVGDDNSKWSPQFVMRFGPIQLVGDASYSIYLWHWPLVMVFVAVQGRSPGWKWMLVLAVVTIVLGVLTKKFVEDPLRRGPGIFKRSLPTYGAMLVGMATIAALTVVPIQVMKAQDAAYVASIEAAIQDTDGCFGAYAVLNNCTNPNEWASTVNPVATSSDTYNDTGLVKTDMCTESKRSSRLVVDCVLNDPEHAALTVVVVGDSHVDHFAVPLRDIAVERDWALRTTRMSSCSGFAQGSDVNPVCVSWGNEAYEQILADPEVDLVLVAIRSALYGPADQVQASERFQALASHGVAVGLIRTVPGTPTTWPVTGPAENAPACVEASKGTDPCAWSPPSSDDFWLRDAVTASGGAVLDTWELLCGDNGMCHTVIGGTIVYFDDNHLATTFARTMTPWLSRQLMAILPS